MDSKDAFIETFKARTKKMAVGAVHLFRVFPKTEEARIIGKQFLRSATSTVANYRAACRGRYKAEFYAKLSITIEEADETLFWLEILEENNILNTGNLHELKKEFHEVVMVVSKARKTMSS